MSQLITEAHVRQFSSNVFHLSQQKGSRLRGLVRNESQKGERAFYDRIGRVAAQLRTTRHGDTPQLDTPHSRRAVDLLDYEWGDMVDDQDKIRMLMDPTSMYAQAAAWALGRSMDEVILGAMNDSAKVGKEGTGPVEDLLNEHKIVCTDGTAKSSLNVLTLRRIKRKLDQKDVDEMIPRYIVVNALMLQSLLGETEVTSSDYASVKALVQGEIDTFMGFKFIRTELLKTAGEYDPGQSSPDTGVVYEATTGELGSGVPTIAANDRVGFAWAQDGILLATGQDITGRIGERPDKSFNTQVYAKMGIGGVRMEEDKVVKFFADE